jgi:hypothetical protein
VKYSDKNKAMICLKRIREPYGPGTPDVVSVGCTLRDDPENPTWKVHIPVDLVTDVCDEMISLVAECVPGDDGLYHDFLL